MAITVDELFKKPFSDRTHEEKIRIISEDIPRPSLNKLIFSNSFIYDKIKFLAGCEIRQKLFCWPCLLFMSPDKQIWGIECTNLEDILEHYEMHEREPDHLEAIFKLQLFRFENGVTPTPRFMENRISTISTFVSIPIIYSICRLIKCSDSFNKIYKSNMLETTDCIEYLKNRNPRDKVTEAAIDLLLESPNIVSDFVDAITIVLKNAIKKELQNSTYVSMVLNAHINNKQMSTVLRYVKDGTVCERFIGFTNTIGFRQNHKSIAEHILNVSQTYSIHEKLLAFSIDGAVLPASELQLLVQMQEFQHVYFVPCYFHRFGHVLMQSVLHFKDSGLFLETLSALESYFENKKKFSRFQPVFFSQMPHLKHRKWYNWYKTVPFVAFLGMYLKQIAFYFAEEIKCADCLPIDDIEKIRSFIAFLEDMDNVFLLKIFSKLFLNQFDENLNLATSVSGKHFDIERFNRFVSNIKNVENWYFQDMWYDTNIEVLPENASESEKISALNSSNRIKYLTLFEEIVSHLYEELELRRKALRQLQFCDLFNESNNGALSCKISALFDKHQRQFDKKTLKTEMAIFKSKPLLHNKSVHDIMEIFHEYNFLDVFTHLYRIAEFVLTLPVLPPSKDFEYKRTKLKQINSFCYIPVNTDVPSGETSVLCIEKLKLHDLQCSENFHDDVIKYYEMKRK